MSEDTQRKANRRALVSRTSCLWLFLLLGLLAVTGLGLSLYARRQLDTMSPTLHVVEEVSGQEVSMLPEIELHLDLSVAQLTMRSAEPGRPFEIRSEYDEAHYVLNVEELVSGSRTRYDVLFRPLSQALSFLRMKVGEDPPLVTILVPPNQPLVVDGRLLASFAAVEAGGLTLDAFELEVDGGAATVSFLEPLQRPMKTFSLIGDKGSLEVTGLGNASPGRVVLDQRFGELDIDLRGPWMNDSTIDVRVFFAGGSCWLPEDVSVRGLEGTSFSIPSAELEIEPTLDLSIDERGGKIIVIR